MNILIKKVVISSIILIILDGIFIYTNMRAFEDQVISVQRVIMQVKPLGAILCYMFLIIGLQYFIINKNRPILDAFIFGLVVYGVYDTTNYTMFKKWNPYLAMMDTLWGGTLMATTTYFTYLLLRL